ncbi:DUF429 domain-containing protein [Lutibaculum baratangense]|uniref:NUDIX hydrolase n=1 Tax=Lutibaculum baratangense AMV1 TaxID=631454 RepID=V4R3G5_9HYPH|nr:DUF429 domain-containing protein [Lutibaculum baratangense]ESR26472.1 hypothetical protein N177_0972 [Lutibaculum baratangense AMV1]
MTRWVAGVDAYRAGWIACVLTEDLTSLHFRVILRLEEIVDGPDAPSIVSVDMPIGLPERIEGSGRACEMAVRPHLGPRQSSVFSTPSRRAVFAGDYAASCAAALATSMPPRKVSKQCFMLFPRIREIDGLLVARPELRARVFETHPEMSFLHMNGGRPASLPKKIRSRANPDGLQERAQLLLAAGMPQDIVSTMERPPAGAGGDDVLDAAACTWTALRILRGEAVVYPSQPPRDANGIEIAIRA